MELTRSATARPLRRIIRNSALVLLLAVILLPLRWWAASIALAIAGAYAVGQLMFTRTCVSCGLAFFVAPWRRVGHCTTCGAEGRYAWRFSK
jgi:hypothetical protein